jgi:hypothetical protein
MPITIEEKKLSRLVKSAVASAIKKEIEREIKPRLEEIDAMMEIIEDAVLGQVAIERLADIEGGLKTVPLCELEKKYGL